MQKKKIAARAKNAGGADLGVPSVKRKSTALTRTKNAAQERWAMCANDPEAGARAYLELYRRRYTSGHKDALPMAIEVCARRGWPLEPWIASAWIEACDKVISFTVMSWDQVLRTPNEIIKTPAKLKKEAARRDRINRLFSLLLAHADDAVDEALFEQLGAELGMNARQARELYYSLPEGFRLRAKSLRKSPREKTFQKKHEKSGT